MHLAMMAAAQRHGEFIADLAAQCRVLGKAQMMRVGRQPAANEARLLGHQTDVFAVANPAWLGVGQFAFVDCLAIGRPSGPPAPPLTG